MKQIIKVIVIFVIIFLLTLTLGFLYLNYHNGDAAFQNYKQEIVSGFQKQITYTIDPQEKQNLQTFVKKLEKVNNKNVFIRLVDKQITSNEESLHFDVSVSQNDIITEMKGELKKIDDPKFYQTMNTKITTLEKETKNDAFFEMVSAIYDELDIYYKAKNIEFFGINDMGVFDFDTEKKNLLMILQKEIETIQNPTIKQELEKKRASMKSVDDESVFFKMLDEVYARIDELNKSSLNMTGSQYSQTKEIDQLSDLPFSHQQ